MQSEIAEIHPLAQGEIADAFDYYEAKQPGRGTQLDDQIGELKARIARFPRLAPMVWSQPEHRVARLERLPYRLPYQIKRDMIRILALAHVSRRPEYWIDRLDPT